MAKQIPLKVVTITPPPGSGMKGDVTFNYREMMLNIAAEPTNKQAGAQISEIREALPLIDALEKADGSNFVVLEDAWHKTLLAKANRFPFAFAHREIAAFIDSIEQAEDAPPVLAAVVAEAVDAAPG